jgi:hypothetical protein
MNNSIPSDADRLNPDSPARDYHGGDPARILMQAAAYLMARELGSPEARICYERAEPSCHWLGRPLLLHVTLIGRWRFRGRLANHDAIAKTFSADTGGKICQYARPLP